MFGFGAQRSHFEKLLHPHLDALYATALKLTGQPADAEDLVQEAVCRGYRFFGKFEAGTNFKAWMFTIMQHQFINTYRKQKSAPLAEESDKAVELHDLSSWDDTPEAKAIVRNEHAQVQKALSNLPDDYKSVLLLADLQEFTYREIADMLNVPIGTVMSRLFRARKLVYKHMQLQASPQEGTIDFVAEKRRRVS